MENQQILIQAKEDATNIFLKWLEISIDKSKSHSKIYTDTFNLELRKMIEERLIDEGIIKKEDTNIFFLINKHYSTLAFCDKLKSELYEYGFIENNF